MPVSARNSLGLRLADRPARTTLVAENADWPFIGDGHRGYRGRANGGGRERERILYEIFPYELFGVAEYFDRGFKMARIAVFSKSARVLKIPWDVVSRVAERYPAADQYAGNRDGTAHPFAGRRVERFRDRYRFSGASRACFFRTRCRSAA